MIRSGRGDCGRRRKRCTDESQVLSAVMTARRVHVSFCACRWRGEIVNGRIPDSFLALASWCAGSVIKQPCEPVLVTYAPGAYGPDAKCRVHRCAARLPARPRPAPLGATNSSPG